MSRGQWAIGIFVTLFSLIATIFFTKPAPVDKEPLGKAVEQDRLADGSSHSLPAMQTETTFA